MCYCCLSDAHQRGIAGNDSVQKAAKSLHEIQILVFTHFPRLKTNSAGRSVSQHALWFTQPEKKGLHCPAPASAGTAAGEEPRA